MPNKCWTPGCKRKYYPTDYYTLVYKSPEGPELRQAWINALHRDHGNPPKISMCVLWISTNETLKT